MVSTWKKKKRKTSKFMDAGSKTGMGEKGIDIMQFINGEEWRRKLKL